MLAVFAAHGFWMIYVLGFSVSWKLVCGQVGIIRSPKSCSPTSERTPPSRETAGNSRRRWRTPSSRPSWSTPTPRPPTTTTSLRRPRSSRTSSETPPPPRTRPSPPTSTTGAPPTTSTTATTTISTRSRGSRRYPPTRAPKSTTRVPWVGRPRPTSPSSITTRPSRRGPSWGSPRRAPAPCRSGWSSPPRSLSPRRKPSPLRWPARMARRRSPTPSVSEPRFTEESPGETAFGSQRLIRDLWVFDEMPDRCFSRRD